jgi:CRP-like cAMP-binding protein
MARAALDAERAEPAVEIVPRSPGEERRRERGEIEPAPRGRAHPGAPQDLAVGRGLPGSPRRHSRLIQMHNPFSMDSPPAAELAQVPLFKSLSKAQLAEAASLFTVRSYPKNAVVATEGDRLDLFNIILSGRIQFFWRDEEGQQVKLGIDGPGGHYADVTLEGEPILMSVIALEDLRVASIPIAALKKLLLRHPRVGLSLLADVVARLRRLVQRTKSFTMEDVYALGREAASFSSCRRAPDPCGDRPARRRDAGDGRAHPPRPRTRRLHPGRSRPHHRPSQAAGAKIGKYFPSGRCIFSLVGADT